MNKGAIKTFLIILMSLAVCTFTLGGVLTALDGKWEISLYFIICLLFCAVIYNKTLNKIEWE